MKQRYTSLLLLVLIFLVGYNIFRTKGIKTDIEGYNQKIDSLQIGIDSVYSLNSKIDNKIVFLNSELNNIDNDITKVQTNIKTIKEKQNEKINNVNQFTFSELLEFFANRYNVNTSGYDSTSKSSNR
jgi:peptidoglycan hydrolase CwlO-like protein